MSVIINGLYQHYKGSMVQVFAFGEHTETGDVLVVYRHVDEGKVWIRPLNLFLGPVLHEGVWQHRFTLEPG